LVGWRRFSTSVRSIDRWIEAGRLTPQFVGRRKRFRTSALESNPIGATYDDLVAMVFAFHTLEGYLNYLGEKIAPDLWRDEREQFADSGFKGKLSSICERCALESPDFGTRPYGTLLELKKLRNAMAHPRTRKTSSKKEYDERKSPPMFHPTYLEQFVTHNKALRAHDDVKSIVTQIHAAALAKFREVDLDPDALEGISSIASVSLSNVQK
jgi:hypothetical protein